MYDVVIIGGGIVGTTTARHLSRYQLRVAVLEAENDVAMGASKANSAIVHGGYSEAHGTLKARLCYQGRVQYAQLNKELNFGFKPIGSFVIATDEEQKTELERLLKNGHANGARDLELLDHDQIMALEPHINPEVKYALYCKGAGICSPYEVTIAMMENAIQNGADLFLKNKVSHIQKLAKGFLITTENGNQFRTRYIVNAAGTATGKISELVGIEDVSIRPRSGQYIIFEKGTGDAINHVLFQTPTKMGKGILVAPTCYGNLVIGPDAVDQDDDDRSTSLERLVSIYQKAKLSVPHLDLNKALRTFSGVRAVSNIDDFLIEESQLVPGFIQAAGIQSPGITAAPAIAHRITGYLADAGLDLVLDPTYNPYRKPLLPYHEPFSPAEVARRVDLPFDDPERLVCRCEQVLQSTMEAALARPIPIESVDALKRRTRCSMGYCQGNFCTSRTVEVMERHLNKKIDTHTDVEHLGYHRVSKAELLAYFEKHPEVL